MTALFPYREITGQMVLLIKHQGALTLNSFPKARVEGLGLPLCSGFPRIPWSKASLVWLWAPQGPHASLPPSVSKASHGIPASVLSWCTHNSVTSSAFPRGEGADSLRVDSGERGIRMFCSQCPRRLADQINSALPTGESFLFSSPQTCLSSNSTWQRFQEHRAGA